MNKIKDMTIYCISHFLVDFLSAIFVLGAIPSLCTDNSSFYISVVTYNFFAFAFQVPLGIILDKRGTYKYIGVLGFCLIALCFLFKVGNPIFLATIVGIGNALFHLEGGVTAYEHSNGKAFLNGVFVAPGAFGVFFGTFFAKNLANTFWPLAFCLLAVVILAFVQKNDFKNIKERKEKFELKVHNNSIYDMSLLLIPLLIGVSIIVRSIGGSAIVYTWKPKDVLWIGATYTLFVVLGKFFGGFIGDKMGYKKTVFVALFLSCIFLILGFNIPFFGFIRNILIQCSYGNNPSSPRKFQC